MTIGLINKMGRENPYFSKKTKKQKKYGVIKSKSRGLLLKKELIVNNKIRNGGRAR